MTRDEVKELMMIMQAAYPNFNPPDKTITINTWYKFLEEYPKTAVNDALSAYIATDTSGFAPSIGRLIDKMHSLFAKQELNEMEAWSLVSKAIRNGSHAEEEYEKLPDLVRKAVGSAGQIRAWSRDERYNESVVSSNFMRTYAIIVRRNSELEKIPAQIRKMIQEKSVLQIE